MVVQHNMQAMNANRMLGITASGQAKSTEKLSSGYKINRAADNAAGLAISEKMRKQIRGLDQASSNAQDGISAVQTAEGALNEVQDIDRVSETTKFNEAYLLRGDNSVEEKYSFSYATAEDTEAAVEFADDTGEIGSEGQDVGTTLTLEVDVSSPDDGVAASDINAFMKSVRDQGLSVGLEVGGGEDGETATPAYNLGLNGEAAKNYTINATNIAGGEFEVVTAAGLKIAEVKVGGGTDDVIGAKQSAVITAKQLTAKENEGDVKQYYDRDGNAISANALKDYFTMSSDGETVLARAGVKLYDAVGNAVDLTDDSIELGVVSQQNLVGDLKLKLHVGADATKNNQITINLQAMSAKGLGVKGLKVDGSDDSNALNAIETIKSALATVSAQRSELGAAQNRLEHTIANLDNIVENTTSAESAIRDTDMAEEMVKYSKSNILAQAGQSMLAQANQSNQGVLSLLG